MILRDRIGNVTTSTMRTTLSGPEIRLMASTNPLIPNMTGVLRSVDRDERPSECGHRDEPHCGMTELIRRLGVIRNAPREPRCGVWERLVVLDRSDAMVRGSGALAESWYAADCSG